ncbi:hypothetical protein DFH07DRAFT_985449 [Mycena maculata]|uniref:Importin 13 n=1 Tax=Mycena maculata TaxID=230809 RepID=A0AAD7I980_9AGAR|nr:hypothetical protein DFH07DRAFT_985449 [Mycena maculata]
MSSSSAGYPPPDVAQAIALIHAAASPPPPPSQNSQDAYIQSIQTAQSALLALQRTPAAWGLVLPLLSSDEVNVQFFGAHTAHAKVARGELDALSPAEQLQLRDVLVREAGRAGRARVVRRKLYGGIVAIAVRVVPGRPGVWESGVWEIQLTHSLCAATPLVLNSILAVLSSPNTNTNTQPPDALPAALACLTAWLPAGVLPGQDVACVVAPLIALLSAPASLNPSSSSSSSSSMTASSAQDQADEARTAAFTALAELLARPPAGWSPKVLLEPLLFWVWQAFSSLSPSPSSYSSLSSFSQVQHAYSDLPPPRKEARRLRRDMRLLVALGDAGVEWVAGCVVDATCVALSLPSVTSVASVSSLPSMGGTEGGEGPERGELARHFLRVMLALGGRWIGVGRAQEGEGEDEDGVDEDEEDEEGKEGNGDEGSLGFWYLALWEVPRKRVPGYAFESLSCLPFGVEDGDTDAGADRMDAVGAGVLAFVSAESEIGDAGMWRRGIGFGGARMGRLLAVLRLVSDRPAAGGSISALAGGRAGGWRGVVTHHRVPAPGDVSHSPAGETRH